MIETLKGIVSQLLVELVNTFTTTMLTAFLNVMDIFFGGLSSGLAQAWQNPLIEAFLYIANTASLTIFVISILFFLLKIAEEEKRNWYVILKCPVMALLFVAINQYGVMLCFLIPDMFITGMSSIGGFERFEYPVFNFTPLLNGFILIIMIVAILYFMYTTVMRFGLMFIQIMTAPFYVPFFVVGDNQKASEWIFSTVAVGFTYLIQYVLFYAGLMMLFIGGADLWSVLIGISLMMSTMKVPAQMKQFGFVGSGGGVMGAANMGMNAMSMMVRAR